jgi:hypothetical protein
VLYEKLGHAYKKEGRLDKAIETFQDGLRIDPQSPNLKDALRKSLDSQNSMLSPDSRKWHFQIRGRRSFDTTPRFDLQQLSKELKLPSLVKFNNCYSPKPLLRSNGSCIAVKNNIVVAVYQYLPVEGDHLMPIISTNSELRFQKFREMVVNRGDVIIVQHDVGWPHAVGSKVGR